MANTELATRDHDIMNEIQENNLMNFSGGVISSISAETQEEKLAIYAAVSDSEELKKMLNKVINVTDVIIQPVEVESEQTHEMEKANRIVLVDDKGKAYGCTSSGVETSLKNLFAIVGMAPWNPAIPLMPVEVRGRNGWDFITLKYAPK